jgi:soluble lytic murein transglycosylase
LHLKDQTIETGDVRADYERETLTRAIRVLADLGEEGLLRIFAVDNVHVYGAPAHIKLLANDLVGMGFREVAVRVAKEASYNDVALLPYSHPVIAVPSYSGSGVPPETAFVLGIIRQETEFDPDAVSSAGARGIMQVMPGSIRHLADKAGVAYRPADVLSDPDYAMKLGMAELGSDLADWSGSYILAAAAYNAGPNNVRKWIAEYGDPRGSTVDPVDWIEEIPFNETRNYVQRVIENTEVYRNRLSGRDEKLQILGDLYRPYAPPERAILTAPASLGSTGEAVPTPEPRPAQAASAAPSSQ